jgi:ribonuclease T2
MNSKTILRLIVGIFVAILGAWQFQGKQSAPEPSHPHHPSGHRHDGSGASLPRDASQHSSGGAQNGRSNQVGDFDYYLVSLSWSPAYCLTHPNDQRQCGGRGFGFVLHGVWPQKSAGGYPEDCPASSAPSAASVQRALAFMPSEKLIQHEWSKHGTCSGLSGDDYLALADKAYSSLKIPKGFEAPNASRTLSSDQILGEFLAANTGLNRDSLTLRCSNSELEEVRICVDKQLKPMNCGKGVRTQCSADAVQIRSVR